MQPNRSVLLVGIASMVSVAVSYLLVVVSADWAQSTSIAGDPVQYRQIAERVLDSAVPYSDITVEHLPAMLVPILGVGAVAELSGVEYTTLWPVITGVALVLSVVLAGSVSLVDRYQARFAVAVCAMLPLVIFRLEIYVVLTALAALAAYERSRYTAGATWACVGSLAKGWPIVLLVIPLRRRAPRVAVVGAAISVLALAGVAWLPGFRAGRAFTGIHSETIVGNLLLVARHVSGEELGLGAAAGAMYVQAPLVALVVNAAVGSAVGAVALAAVFRTRDLADLARAGGLATLAILLASPLLSAQFVFWLTPFVPLLSKSGRRLAFSAGAFSTLLVAFWSPTQAWWASAVAGRNALLLTLAVVWAQRVHAQHRLQQASAPAARESSGTLAP